MKKLFTLLAALMILVIPVSMAEEAPEAYFPEDMAEFVSDTLGFSVLYPSVFADYAVDSEDPSLPGLKAILPDESASLQIIREENVTNLVNETWIALTLQEFPDAESNINEISGTSRILLKREDSTEFICCLFTAEWKYSVKITWTAEHDEEFSRLADYVGNSLTVYTLGIG